ncbi:PucR C-terminal helix-turn-helix domain-containing protein [Nocardioides sp. YR527]|nr:PucR C-terminal helix-turn-helix domain-containing protein [Nocardioides sp. YR527]
MTTSEPLGEWLRNFSERAVVPPMSEEFVARVDSRITSQIPEISSDPMLIDDLHGSTRAQWRAFVLTLSIDHTLMLPPAAADLARSLARRGMDLGVLLKVYRAAHQAVFEFFTDVSDTIGESGPRADEVLRFLWTRAERWMNDSVEALIETFYEERSHMNEGALIRRTRLIEDILQGAAIRVDHASAELSHALAHWQTAGVVWTTATDSADAARRLQNVAGQLARRIRAPRPLTLLTSGSELCFWAATPARPDLGSLFELAGILEESQAHLAFGVPSPGPAGFRSGHSEAKAAQRVGLDATPSPPVVDYSHIELLCLVSESPQLVRRMVEREIGDLGAPDKNLAQVRHTVLTHFDNGFNVEKTARHLFIHRNTVRYRLSRAEELIGHSLTERTAKIDIALRYVALFGPPAD